MLLLDYGAYIVIPAAIIMPLYWILSAIYLPMKERYINWVSLKKWIWVNSIGFATLQFNRNPSIACLIVVDIKPLLLLFEFARRYYRNKRRAIALWYKF
jgi:hypothetical protein